MILVENKIVSGIPLLHVAQKDKVNNRLPLVIFVHGFESAKENNLHYAYLLADKGFRVVLPEAIYHGERELSGMSGKKLHLRFWEIVVRTIHELEIIKNYFEDKDLVDSSNIGVAGTSMGGIVTFGALTKYSWIKASVSLMGMPSYVKYAKMQIEHLSKKGVSIPFNDDELKGLFEQLSTFDISKNPEVLNERPLLFWHGQKDPIVPHSLTYQFYETIKPKYNNSPEKLQFISDEKADHKVSRLGVLKLVDWFEQYLTPSNHMIYVTSENNRT